MITSDLAKAGSLPVDGINLGQPLDAAGQGFPDPAVIARMANELFKDSPLPAGASSPNLGVTGLVLSPLASTIAPPTTIPAIPNIPSAATAGAIPASVPGVALQPLPTVTTGANAPTLPGAPRVIPFTGGSAGSGFAFLDEARSLFSIDSPSLPSVPTSFGVPFEGDLQNFASLIPGHADAKSIAPITGDYSDPKLPQIAGAPTQHRNQPLSTDGLPEFARELNSIVPIDVRPEVSPVANSIGGLPSSSISSGFFDVSAIRRDFPILSERVNGRQLIWLDNAATTQKPQAVIDRLVYFYQHENSNIHRAAHTLAARATDAYEGAREKVRRFLNAGNVNEIIFVRGATEAINLIAQTYGKRNVQKDDEIVITHLEHHANIVPWQMLCAEKGAKLRVAPVDNTGQIILEEYEKLFNAKTKIASIAHVSNALGTVTPVREMTEIAHRFGAKVVIDGAQAVSHMRVDVQEYDCDFYVFSGHKLFAPTGIGVVYGKQDVLQHMPPYQGGGNMISDVTFEKTQYHNPPMRFEAGTGNIADAVGLGAAIDYLDRVGMHNIARYEHDLLIYGTERLLSIPGLHLIGTAKEKASVLSFVLDGFKTEEVGQGLAQQGIAVRSGHHCAQPILRRFGQESSVRPSLAFYNTCEEIDALIAAIWNIKSGRLSSVL